MSKPEFNQYARQYDRLLRDSIPDALSDNDYFAEYKIALTSARFGTRKPTRVLDFGCGPGRSLPYLRKYFPEARLFGFDPSPASLEVAAKRAPEAIFFSNWADIKKTHFDVIVASNVFHHIPVGDRPKALSQCRQALAESGQMFLFEHNPYNPLTRWVFDRCPFDADAEMLDMKSALTLARAVGFQSEQHGYTLFFPKQLSVLRRFEPWLKRLPIGAQYYVQLAS